MTINGYIEEGTTTSPFMMMVLNKTSRYDVAAEAVRSAALLNPRVEIEAHATISRILHLAEKDKEYILAHGVLFGLGVGMLSVRLSGVARRAPR